MIVTLGNRAVHSHKTIAPEDALAAVRELFHVATGWPARTGAMSVPRPVWFDPTSCPRPPSQGKPPSSYSSWKPALRERDEKLTALLADKTALDEELKRLREEVADAKNAAKPNPIPTTIPKTETRDYFIDLLLKEAGWPLDQQRDREFPVTGMPNKDGKGFVDYVLWGDDGKPLGLVEAKRTKRDPRVGQQQAELYADCLERHLASGR